MSLHTSKYDPSRPTIGKIYRDAQMANDNIPIINGDMTNELKKSLVDDINEAILEYDKREKPYYLMVHEKKDLQMKTAILRRMLYFSIRPWPEDDTIVFWKDPKTQDLRFCWCLPHWSEMPNILENSEQYDQEMIMHIKAWRSYNLKPFGFYYDKKLKWIPNPHWKDRKMTMVSPTATNKIVSV